MPYSLRLAVRRRLANRKRRHVRNTWPILPGSEKRPEDWRGWPENKQFGFILTHDVESQRGLEKCRQLMDLEMKLGFRSSFNFIPEGNYNVSKAIRDEMRRNGFEVGVHDLRHDGKLFRSRDQFREHASSINEHLRDWGAVGFRSGFMLSKLDWLHDLNIQYDASTFDTDPFEPQPKGAATIFPFWVPRVSKPKTRSTPADVSARFSPLNPRLGETGYVELPYTLPQDSTLFLVLRETTDEIWKEKLHWLAKQGGMVLMNTHPDYMNFDCPRAKEEEFDARLYQNFLLHVKEKYGGAFWHALPQQVASWVRTGAQSL